MYPPLIPILLFGGVLLIHIIDKRIMSKRIMKHSSFVILFIIVINYIVKLIV
jgi:hypothetical protein